MLTVRCTAKLLKRVHAETAVALAPSTTRLGDWYATILPLRPAHLVLLINESTRLPVVLPAREISTLARRIPEAIARALTELGVDAPLVAEELRAMSGVTFAKTASRQVLGTMNQFAFELEHARASNPHMKEEALARWLGDGLTTVGQLGYQVPAELVLQAFGADPSPPGASQQRRAEARMIDAASIYELKITLRDIKPPIWRRIRVASDISLYRLHGILQHVMGWTDSHLHQFVAHKKIYGLPDPEFPAPRENEKRALLNRVLRDANDSLTYEYDFGDGWEHDVTLERVLEAQADEKYPLVLAGARACPPEDCGGISGYERLVKVLANKQHPEHREMLEWVGGAFDPEAFDMDAINRGFHGRTLAS